MEETPHSYVPHLGVMLKKIDYDSLLPIALRFLYPEEPLREGIEIKLSAYGAESFHKEISRVKLGILYLTATPLSVWRQ